MQLCYQNPMLKAHCTSLTKRLTYWLTVRLSVDALQETLTVG